MKITTQHSVITTQLNETAPSNLYDRAFQNFPKEQFWRMFIDWSRQDNNPLVFDKDEPGYHQGMMRGFDYIKETIGQKLTVEMFKEIHTRCVTGVLSCDEISDEEIPFETGFSFENATIDEYEEYSYSIPSMPPEAKEEAQKQNLLIVWSNPKPSNFDLMNHLSTYIIRNDYGHKQHCIESLSFLHLEFSTACNNPSTAPRKRIENLINNYYEQITKANSSDEKLVAIVNLCRALEIYHVFRDGNQRTIAFALLNKLLIENNFSPAILGNPFIFDGPHTTQEMIQAVHEGMKIFQGFCR
jgi:hypothetical protein